jgi:hypothetical protein
MFWGDCSAGTENATSGQPIRVSRPSFVSGRSQELCCATDTPTVSRSDIARVDDTSHFDCGWSLLNHGVANTKRLNLGNLNPIYERELTKLELHQGEGRWSVSKNGARRRGCRHK